MTTDTTTTITISKATGAFQKWAPMVDAALAEPGTWLEADLGTTAEALRAANSIALSRRATIRVSRAGSKLRWMAEPEAGR